MAISEPDSSGENPGDREAAMNKAPSQAQPLAQAVIAAIIIPSPPVLSSILPSGAMLMPKPRGGARYLPRTRCKAARTVHLQCR